MRRRSVVLPEPLSPRMVRNSPSSTCREMARSTGSLPKLLATARIESRDWGLVAGWALGEVMRTRSQESGVGSQRGNVCNRKFVAFPWQWFSAVLTGLRFYLPALPATEVAAYFH